MAKKPTYKELEQEVGALRKTVSDNKYLERIYHSITQPIIILDPNQNILSVNLSAEKLSEHTLNELIGKKCYQIFHDFKATSPPDSCPFQMVLSTGKSETIEVVEETLNGFFLVSLSPVFDNNNKLQRVIHIGTDITNKIKTERKLRESENKYRALFEQAVFSIVLIDAKTGALVEFNNMAHENLGFTREEFEKLKIPDFEVIEADEEVAMHIEKIVKEGSDRFETKHRTKDGEIRDIHVNSKALSLHGGDFIQSIWRDITDRKRSEEALQKAHDELEKKVEERTVELSKVNEELKNKTINLEEANIALKVLLKKRDEDKIELEEKVLSNVKELIFPYIENLKMRRLDDRQMGLLDIIESNLNEIITPFLRKLSLKYSNLTPKEIQVAGLVKEGKTSKEIAELLDSNKNAVEFHRRNLRKKLGIRNTKTNLSSYLLSLS
jgi:PAS domain S-box-containing protein